MKIYVVLKEPVFCNNGAKVLFITHRHFTEVAASAKRYSTISLEIIAQRCPQQRISFPHYNLYNIKWLLVGCCFNETFAKTWNRMQQPLTQMKWHQTFPDASKNDYLLLVKKIIFQKIQYMFYLDQ